MFLFYKCSETEHSLIHLNGWKMDVVIIIYVID